MPEVALGETKGKGSEMCGFVFKICLTNHTQSYLLSESLIKARLLSYLSCLHTATGSSLLA